MAATTYVNNLAESGLTTSSPSLIIAEVGINHNGSVGTAKMLIEQASEAGVNAIKFQYRNLQNAYSLAAKEIGDELLRTEIIKNFLDPEILVMLSQYTHELGMDCGISFFTIEDMQDFGTQIEQFDFMKVPSPELTNSGLIDAMLTTGAHVYISTGCHSELEIENALKRLSAVENWTPLHCISNYPTMLQNARLGYINHMRRCWNRSVGYSSHDENWQVCLLALQLGATVIERHITLDKNAMGLDHTSSSTPDEFAQLCAFSKNMGVILSGDDPRACNQGELLNRQNLGRSYFAAVDMDMGDTLSLESVVYRSPNTGISNAGIQGFIGRTSVTPIKQGMPITKSLFDLPGALPDEVIEFSRSNAISLPVRLHDIKEMAYQFPIGAYEFHLSFEEVNSDIDLSIIESTNRYSIHLPDYISSTALMDPFSTNLEQRKASLEILERTVRFAERLQDMCGTNVPIVGSFSIVHTDLNRFFDDYANLVQTFQQHDVEVLPQWLPPIAWYFGGSVELNVMNSLQDVELIQSHNLSICMDVCHLIMCRNSYGYSATALMDTLNAHIRHLHIADARGIDGEGVVFGDGEPENLDLIHKAIAHDCLKVIEVWQGHLDRGAGFRDALLTLSGFNR